MKFGMNKATHPTRAACAEDLVCDLGGIGGA
jgi:hypothetical protein